MRILVAGANRVDAGKTTFSVGLLDRTGATGFKPRAGNDFWFDHDDVGHSVRQGRLFGKDARRLAAASPGEVVPEAINPVHRLWRPSPGSATGILGQEDREFVLDRAGEQLVVNETVETPAVVREHLDLSDAIGVRSLSAFNEVMADAHLAAQKRVATDIDATERAVVESYGDVARPYSGVEADAAAVVEPGRVRIYDGERYEKACEVATGGPESGQLEERVPSVVDLLDPQATVGLPALGSEERASPSKVATAYASAYDALLDVALD
ncbi:ATPase [Haloarculaceae archaeon H-GB2-1]|nr:ATPase [Haloarculaceae archaeon H-GB1-1]MEA5386000.1 ATPase [Haloarculaceae archaeon H-GB11]MEA5407504.1 ATPase [Haloarculaceae archaeon H-GB2-1]